MLTCLKRQRNRSKALPLAPGEQNYRAVLVGGGKRRLVTLRAHSLSAAVREADKLTGGLNEGADVVAVEVVLGVHSALRPVRKAVRS